MACQISRSAASEGMGYEERAQSPSPVLRPGMLRGAHPGGVDGNPSVDVAQVNLRPAAVQGGPQFVALDRQGNVYTTEASVGRVQKFSRDGKYLLSWGTNSTEPGGFGSVEGSGVFRACANGGAGQHFGPQRHGQCLCDNEGLRARVQAGRSDHAVTTAMRSSRFMAGWFRL